MRAAARERRAGQARQYVPLGTRENFVKKFERQTAEQTQSVDLK
jgi:hypothetical protein